MLIDWGFITTEGRTACQEPTRAPWVQLHCSIPPRTAEKVEQNLIKCLIILQVSAGCVVEDVIKKVIWFIVTFFNLGKNNVLMFKTKFQLFPPPKPLFVSDPMVFSKKERYLTEAYRTVVTAGESTSQWGYRHCKHGLPLSITGSHWASPSHGGHNAQQSKSKCKCTSQVHL